jgi:hypothetical protein
MTTRSRIVRRMSAAVAVAAAPAIAAAESAAQPQSVQVPEPALLALFGIGLIAVALVVRRR